MAGSDGSPRRQLDYRKALGTVQSYWNAPFRGLTPGGWPQDPPATDAGDVPPFEEDVEDYIPADPLVPIEKPGPPTPVVLVEDLSHTRKRVEKYLIATSFNVPLITPQLMVPRNPFRTQTIINNTSGQTIYLGHNESILTAVNATVPGGFALPLNSVVVLGTTREIWVVGAVAALTPVSIIQEYDKDTVEE